MLFGGRWKHVSIGTGQGSWKRLQETQWFELDLRDEWKSTIWEEPDGTSDWHCSESPRVTGQQWSQHRLTHRKPERPTEYGCNFQLVQYESWPYWCWWELASKKGPSTNHVCMCKYPTTMTMWLLLLLLIICIFGLVYHFVFKKINTYWMIKGFADSQRKGSRWAFICSCSRV